MIGLIAKEVAIKLVAKVDLKIGFINCEILFILNDLHSILDNDQRVKKKIETKDFIVYNLSIT